MGLREHKFEVQSWNFKFESQLVRNWRINKLENLIKIWISLINEIMSLIEELISLRT